MPKNLMRAYEKLWNRGNDGNLVAFHRKSFAVERSVEVAEFVAI